MNIIQAIILSIIEGVTEFLPISSTGHMILASHLMHIPQTDFTSSFEIIIQFGAILAVLFIYFRKIISSIWLWPKIILAFIPTGILGLLLYKFIKTVLLGNQLVVVISLLIGGIILVFTDKLIHGKQLTVRNQTTGQSLLIGLAQSVSMIPGVSRSAATIIGGMAIGLTRYEAVEFSFLLAIPTMAAATGLDLVKSSLNFTQPEITLLIIGFVGAFITAFFSVRVFISYIQKHNFRYFGYYRIALSLLYALFFLR